MKLLILLLFMSFSNNAYSSNLGNAISGGVGGLIGGYIGGELSRNADTTTDKNYFILSDEGDILTCHTNYKQRCLVNGFNSDLSVLDFIKTHGYNTLVRRGVIVIDGTSKILMIVK